MANKYLPLSKLDNEILEFLWSRGIEGCQIYVPKKEESGTKLICAKVLKLMEDDYDSKGRTFLDSNGQSHRLTRMPQAEAAKRLNCNRKKVAAGWRRAVDRWNRWFQDHERRTRSDLLSSLPRMDASAVMLAYQAARAAVKEGGNPEQAMQGVVSSKILKRDGFKEKVIQAAKKSVRSGPLREEERRALKEGTNDEKQGQDSRRKKNRREKEHEVKIPSVF